MGQPVPPPPPQPKRKIKIKKHKDRADLDDTTVRDVHTSKEFSQCTDPSEKTDILRREKIEEISKSCRDLAIDG